MAMLNYKRVSLCSMDWSWLAICHPISGHHFSPDRALILAMGDRRIFLTLREQNIAMRDPLRIYKYYWIVIEGVPKMGLPQNHPFLMGVSIINHPFWGTPSFGKLDFYGKLVYNGGNEFLWRWWIPDQALLVEHPIIQCNPHICSMYGIVTYIWVILG